MHLYVTFIILLVDDSILSMAFFTVQYKYRSVLTQSSTLECSYSNVRNVLTAVLTEYLRQGNRLSGEAFIGEELRNRLDVGNTKK